MIEKVFVDTNVLVYARDSSEPAKQVAAAAWMRHLWEKRSGCLSIQVSAAKATGAARLLTEDLQEWLQMDGVVVVSPFHGKPG